MKLVLFLKGNGKFSSVICFTFTVNVSIHQLSVFRYNAAPTPCLILIALAALKNRSNKCSWSSFEMPIPLSLIRNSISLSDTFVLSLITEFSGENLIAFDNKFKLICLNIPGQIQPVHRLHACK